MTAPFSIDLMTTAGLRVRLTVDGESLMPDLAREELAFFVARNLSLFPEGQRRAALAMVRKLAVRHEDASRPVNSAAVFQRGTRREHGEGVVET